MKRLEDNPDTTDAQSVERDNEDETPSRPQARAPLRQLLLYPLIVAGGCALAFGAIGWLTEDPRTPEDLLNLVHNAEGRQRWQAAHELARRGAADDALRTDRQLGCRVVSLFSSAREDDTEVAGYLARVLALMAPEGAEAALVEALASSHGRDRSGSASLRIQVALALEEVGTAGSISALAPLLTDEDGGVRKAAAYALARLANCRIQTAPTLRAQEAIVHAVELLVPLLGDREVDVRWNAALGLATLGSDAGYDVLQEMLNRDCLNEVSARSRGQGGRGMDGREVSDVMVNAVRAAARLERPELRGALEGLRDKDESPRVREAACLALARIDGE